MRKFLALIPLLIAVPQESAAAQAGPAFSHALSDVDLAEESAGRGIVVHLEDAVRKDQGTARVTDIIMCDCFGIQTLVLDTGASSITEAATSLILRATLKDTPLLNVGLRPGF